MSDNPIKWHECDSTMVHQLTAATYKPGNLYPYPTGALPAGIRAGMPGLKDAFVSGYINPKLFSPGLSGLGEFVAVRDDGDTGKGYNYGFAISEDGKVYYAGPHKYFEGHHWEKSEPVPVDDLFGHFEHYTRTSLSDFTSISQNIDSKPLGE